MKLRSELHTPEKSGLPSASFGAGPDGTALPLPLPLALVAPSSSCATAVEMVSSATAAAPAIRSEPTRCLFMAKPPRTRLPLARIKRPAQSCPIQDEHETGTDSNARRA